MAQTWTDILSTDFVSDSRAIILQRDEVLKSNFSGTSYPTTNLVIGMHCYRTDLEAEYRLMSTGPDVWRKISDITDFGDAAFETIGTSGATVPKNNTANTFSQTLTLSAANAANVGANKILGDPGNIDFGSNSVTLNVNATRSLDMKLNSVEKFKLYSDGGVTVGLPSGGSKGDRTLNAFSIYLNGTALGTASTKDVGTASTQIPLNSNLGTMAYQSAGAVTITGGTITGVSLNTPHLHLQDQKAANTDGGTFTNGAWRTRTLNTEVTDTVGSTLAANQFTLPAGTYDIVALAPALAVGGHKAGLYNVTDAAFTLIGTSANTNTATSTHSVVSGRFTIADTKTFELRHRSVSSRATDGFGQASNLDGQIEIYSDVKIWKVS